MDIVPIKQNKYGKSKREIKPNNKYMIYKNIFSKLQ